MATTTLTVTYDGQPLVGAEVCMGSYMERFLTTDENGQIISDLAKNFAIVAPVVVRHASVGTVMGSVLLIESGASTTLDIQLRSTGE